MESSLYTTRKGKVANVEEIESGYLAIYCNIFGGRIVTTIPIVFLSSYHKEEFMYYKKQRKYIFSLVVMMGLLTTTIVDAMHIAEGFLPKTHAAIWYAITIPFFVVGVKSIAKIVNKYPEKKLLLALAGAYVFLLSSLKLPAMTGSCSHPTGVGLGAILFGAMPMFVLGTIVLIFQAIILAHGGLTTLGANAFSMAIVGPIVAVIVYKLCQKLKANNSLSVFLAAALADLITYCITAIQLAMAFPKDNFILSMLGYLEIFAITQIPIAIMEGIVTVLVYNGIKQYEGGILSERFN